MRILTFSLKKTDYVNIMIDLGYEEYIDLESYDTFDDDEHSDVYASIYEQAVNESLVVDEKIEYCDQMMEEYRDFVEKAQVLNPEKQPEEIVSLEEYFWKIFYPRYKD